MIGKIKRSGIGQACEEQEARAPGELWKSRGKSNEALRETLREDPHSEWILGHTTAEAELGRMTAPVSWEEGRPMEGCLLHPRFSRDTVKEDGSLKLRGVDHFSWSDGGGKQESVNGFTVPGVTAKGLRPRQRCCCALSGLFAGEKLKHDTIDQLEGAMKSFVDMCSEIPWLCKACLVSEPRPASTSLLCFCLQADIDAAFRRIPVKPEHRKWCGVAFKRGCKVRAGLSCGNQLPWGQDGRISPTSFAGLHSATQRLPFWGHWLGARMGEDRRSCALHCANFLASGATAVRRRLLRPRQVGDTCALLVSESVE